MVTLKDVAKRAGVSVATASRVLNGNENVAPESQRRVEEAINELGYYSNSLAKSLRQDQSNIIAVTVPSLELPFFADVLLGIDDVLSTAGYNVLFKDVTEDDEILKDSLKTIRGFGVAGSILFHPGKLSDDLLSLCSGPFPCFVFSVLSTSGSGSVEVFRSNLKESVHLVLEEYAKRQLHDIFLVFPPNEMERIVKALKLKDYGGHLHYISANNGLDAYRICSEQPIDEHSGFVLFNDLLISGVQHVIAEKRLSCPIASWGNSPIAQSSFPAVISFSPFGYQVGTYLASCMLARIEERNIGALDDVALMPSIVLR